MAENQLERCINQVFRPKIKTSVNPEGTGDCYNCSYDPVNNPKCKAYYPITITIYNVYERQVSKYTR